MKPLRILLVEDNDDHAALIRTALASCGPANIVETAVCGKQLLSTVQVQRYDCILLDFHLPDARGDQLLVALKRHGCDCPVIVLSSSESQSIAIQTMRNGGADFVPKSVAFDARRLWERIEYALDTHRTERRERRLIERRVRRLAQEAETDPLTGLYNRLCLTRLMNDPRERERRGCGIVVMIDVDGFKLVNDRHGHLCGDEFLREVGGVLRNSALPGDLVFRWGGDEFMVVRFHGTLAGAATWTEAVRERIARWRVRQDGTDLQITVSAGLAVSPDGNLTLEFVAQADQALYMAKHRGRNRLCTWPMVRVGRLVEELRRTIETGIEPRLAALVTRCEPELGVTQRRHLTAHSAAVADFAVSRGRTMGFDAQTLGDLRLAGLMHDLGKLFIPETVLAKPGPLSAEERCLIDRHAADGAWLSEMLGADRGVTEYVRYHHTSAQELIRETEKDARPMPPGARVLAVADAFVTMTNKRPYRAACAPSGAVWELRRCGGVQFDQEIVQAIPRALGTAPRPATACLRRRAPVLEPV